MLFIYIYWFIIFGCIIGRGGGDFGSGFSNRITIIITVPVCDVQVPTFYVIS